MVEIRTSADKICLDLLTFNHTTVIFRDLLWSLERRIRSSGCDLHVQTFHKKKLQGVTRWSQSVFRILRTVPCHMPCICTQFHNVLGRSRKHILFRHMPKRPFSFPRLIPPSLWFDTFARGSWLPRLPVLPSKRPCQLQRTQVYGCVINSTNKRAYWDHRTRCGSLLSPRL